jgi:hypothetical protein
MRTLVRCASMSFLFNEFCCQICGRVFELAIYLTLKIGLHDCCYETSELNK